jgi:phosphatidylglycerophosphate synthase
MANHDNSMIYTISNGLSALRGVLAIPAVWAVWTGRLDVGIWMCVAASITDVLDGRIARARNEVSELGKLIDPVFDKIFVAGIVLAMTIKGYLPVWFTGVVIGRDILILLAGMTIRNRKRVTLMSNTAGKVAVTFIGFTILDVLFEGNAYGIAFTILASGSMLSMAWSLTNYSMRMMKELRSEQN